ncbi:MAG: hypothetical protein EYC70_08740 [Planctomycetota bacterium]|nr:MAG: hypothetical protein EYC70_08740 [Planctomycetota bacterium]
MSDDYLWDRSGPPDPQVAELERKLERFRWKGELPQLEAPRSGEAGAWRRWGRLASAAGVLLAAGAVAWLLAGERGGVEPSYVLEVLSGVPQVDGGGGGGVQAGDRIRTGAHTRARLHVGDIGSVVLEPDSRLRVEHPRSGDAEYELYLEGGTLTASIFAAPRLFQVGTPAGTAVDLGCVYSATVLADGSTLLRVISGRVSFEAAAREALVPAHASVRAYPDTGPGTPTWDDAPETWREAVAYLDRPSAAKDPGAGMEEALEVVLATEREQDSLTLWHLLRHPSPGVRERVYERLAALAPPPPEVSREGLLAGAEDELESWREHLGWAD